MTNSPGLRERKKIELRRLLADVALELFSKRGFNAVTVAEVAAAANVSEKTVFNHFATKEDLLLSGREELWMQLFKVIGERDDNVPVFAIVRQHALSIASQFEKLPGKKRTAFCKIVQSTPAIHMRMFEMALRYESQIGDLLAAETKAKPNDPTLGAVASLIGPLIRIAFGVGWGESKSRTDMETRSGIAAVFDQVERGLASYGRRKRER